MKRQIYLDHAYKVADLVWQDYDTLRHRAVEEGKAALRDWGRSHNTFQFVGTVAPAEAMRHRQTGSARYLNRAKQYLLDVYDVYHTLKAYQEAQNITIQNADFPTLGWMFEPEPYIYAYNAIKGIADFTDAETAQIETVVDLAMRPIAMMPEYGPMNRSMLRALNLAAAGSSFPAHPDAQKWLKMGRHVFADSLDKWSMEDSGPYQSIWLYSFIAYNEYVPTVPTDESSVVKHYADLWARLVTPLGFIPDYGDAELSEDWIHLAAVMEKCATLYRSATLKYAVNRFTAAHVGLDSGLAGGVTRFLRQLVSAYEWADEGLAQATPTTGSQEACDDTIGKKCVFRDGWDRASTYLLLNYRDAPQTNEIYRKNLPMTIPVKAEKTHHGHNDENALCMLVAQERILLSESGYRKGAERDCTYRSDYYHNKLVVRQGVNRAHSFFDHILDFGEYNPVRTERVYFYTFDEVDCSRTRLYDSRNAAVCDRIVYYLKNDGCFIVNDIVLPQEDDSYTLGPVYHAQTIEPIGGNSYALSQAEISMGPELTYTQTDDVKLYLHFPLDGYDVERRTIDRAYRDQMAVGQFFAGYASGQFPLFFSSVLYPSRQERPSFFDTFSYQKRAKGVGLHFSIGARTYTLFDRYCYESKIEDLNKRPAYSFDAGREQVFALETDAYAALTIEEDDATYFCGVDFSTLIHKGRSLFGMEAMDQLQLDFKDPLKRTTSWSNWDDRVRD
ncbi:MAG: hypothetical protein GKR89_20765 [Candidatus Latescibacteria bacterium]|nr:hypothetical protein [Candidatus Latescibacterota bacterium]